MGNKKNELPEDVLPVLKQDLLDYHGAEERYWEKIANEGNAKISDEFRAMLLAIPQKETREEELQKRADEALKRAKKTLIYVGEMLHEQRTKFKKSIEEISFDSGVSRKNVVKIECGMDTGNVAHVLAVAQALGVDYAKLFMDALGQPLAESIRGQNGEDLTGEYFTDEDEPNEATLSAEQKRAAWDFAQGMIGVDNLKTSDEMNALIESEISGEITTADIKKELDEKYGKYKKETEKLKNNTWCGFIKIITTDSNDFDAPLCFLYDYNGA